MDPLITNGIDPALLRVIDKRGDTRDAMPRRKRHALPSTALSAEDDLEDGEQEGDDTQSGAAQPKHSFDDLA